MGESDPALDRGQDCPGGVRRLATGQPDRRELGFEPLRLRFENAPRERLKRLAAVAQIARQGRERAACLGIE